MCADNSSRRGRNSAGRQRPSPGAVPVLGNRPGSQPARSAFYVGRVGALAVALGVGTGILGFTGAAAADTGSGETAGSAGQDSTRTGDSRSATGNAATGPRRSPRRGAPAPAQAVGVPSVSSAADTSESEPTSRGRRSGGPRSGAAVTVTQGRKAGTPARAVPAAPGDLAVLGARLTPGGMQNLIQDSVVSLFGSISSAVSAGGVVAELTSTPQVLSAPQVVDAVAIEPPVMTATPDALAEGAVDSTALLGEDGSGGPGAEPFAWAALAAARRENLTGVTPELEPAAAVTTGEPAAAGDPAAAEGTDLGGGLGAGIAISNFTPTSGAVGTTITITAATGLGGVTEVKFGCQEPNCEWGVTTTPLTTAARSLTVKVPPGAPSGKIQVLGVSFNLPVSGFTNRNFTVTGSALPTITNFTPSASIGDPNPIIITGTNFTDALFVNFGAGSTTSLEVLDGGTKISVLVPDGATTGPIVVGTPVGGVVSTTNFTVPVMALPDLPTCTTGNCGELGKFRPLVINQLSTVVGNLLPTSGPVGNCTAAGCPVPYGQITPSVANTIGEYAFNVVYLLTGATGAANAPTNQDIGQSVVNLVTQPNVLNFISQTVAGNKLLVNAPQSVQNLVGNAVANFVQMTFGNLSVATALVPFLKTLNLPTATTDGALFALAMLKDPSAAILARFNSTQQGKGQAALQTFFQDSSVQQVFGTAITTSVMQLLGVPELGQPQPAPVLADYLGQLAASALLSRSVADDNPLAATLGNTIQTLFNNIGLVVATDAGDAFVDFLNEPALDGELAVATTLANNLVNEVVRSLGGTPTIPPSSLFGYSLAAALAPAAGVTATGLVNSLLSSPAVTGGLGQFLTEVVPEILGDQDIQGEVTARIIGIFGTEFGTPIANTVVGLMSDTTVTGALTTFVNTTFGTFLGSFGVVPTLADAAGTLTTAQLEGNFADVLKQVQASLETNAFIDDGVGAGVTAGTAGLLGNTEFWDEVNNAFASLVGTLLTDSNVQGALSQLVSDQVASKFKNEAVGKFIGDQVGTVVVELITNPVVERGLLGVVDTLLADFWQADGVVSAFSVAFGALAAAQLAGDFDQVSTEVLQSLQANLDVQAALANSFGAATTDFLSDRNLWSAVNGTLSAAVIELTTDPVALAGLNQAVQAAVTERLGEPLAGVVAPQIGDAVVSLVSNPVVAPALLGVVDTLFSDFFGAPGVVDDFATAAGQWGLVLFTTFDPTRATAAAQQVLMNSDAIDDGVDVSVTAAVAELLGNTQLWRAVDSTVSSLVGTLLTDIEVQQALNSWVAAQVADQIPGPVGQFLGDQLGTLVVELVTNPVISSGLLAVFDTLSANFWGTPGVVDAFSGATGALAKAALTDDLDTVLPEVVAGLRSDIAVQAAAEASVGAAVNEFLSDTDLWSAVDGTLSAAVISLTTDPVVLAALEKSVTDTVGARFGPTVGAQVGAAVVALVSDPAVVPGLLGVVDTLFSDFIGAPDVVETLSVAAGQLALVLVTGGDLEEAVKLAQEELRNTPAIDDAIDVSVTAAVTEFFGDGPLWTAAGQTVSTLLGGVLADSDVQNFVGTTVTDAVTNALGASPIAAPVGQAVGAAVQQLLATAGAPAALGTAFGLLLPNFLGASGVADALGEAAGALASAALTRDLATVIPEVLAALRDNIDLQAAVGVVVTDALGPLLSDTAFVDALGATMTSLVSGLLSNDDVQLYANTAVTDLVTTALAPSPIAEPVGAAIGAAVQALLGTAGVASGLGTIIGSLLPDFLESPGVPAAIADAAGILAAAVIADDLNEALSEVAATLLANPDVVAALKITIADALGQVVSELLSVPDIQQELGTIATTLIEELAGNAAVQAFVADQLGAPLGPIVAGLLATTAVVDEVAVVLGSAVTGFLSYPGFSAALAGSINLFADELLDGTNRDAALRAAVQELQSDPAFIGAVNAVVPFAVNSILRYSNVRQAIGAAARDETIALLGASGIDNRFVQRVAGQLVEGTVEALLRQRAAKNLIDDVTVNVLLGLLPLTAVSDYVVDEVLHEPVLQIALGASIGQGIGSLFGDNIIGDLIGLAAGLPAATLVVVAAAIINIYQWLFGGRSATETPLPGQDLHDDSHFFQLQPAVTDLYVMNAIWISAPMAARG